MAANNERGAGRKCALNREQRVEAAALYRKGEKIQELAEKYGVSRQTMSSYLHPKKAGFREEEGFVLQLDYMFRNRCCTSIWVNFKERRIRIENQTPNILHRAFGVKASPQWEDFELFLKERCFPPSRDQIKNVLADLELDSYDPLAIIEKTCGQMAEDQQWIRLHYLVPENLSGNGMQEGL